MNALIRTLVPCILALAALAAGCAPFAPGQRDPAPASLPGAYSLYDAWDGDAAPSALARAFGRPIALTSANKSGGADATNAQDAFLALETAVPLFLDAGETAAKTPSTVLLCLKNETKILREGAVPADDLSIQQ